MIDKLMYLFMGWLDRWSDWVDKMFIEKPKRKNK